MQQPVQREKSVKVLKICTGTWENASRDKRELSAYKEAGAEVVVMAKGKTTDRFYHEIVEGFDVYRFSTTILKRCNYLFAKKINYAVCTVFWSFYARRFRADVLSCHDVYALLIGWLSTLFTSKNKPILIYDSHEFEAGRNSRRSRLFTKVIISLERFLIKKCAFSIVVCDSIAAELQNLHKMKTRPLVIRSTPEYWQLDPEICRERRRELFAHMPDSVDFLMMYHGNINKGRGIELLLPILKERNNIGLVLMGAKQSKEEFDILKKTAHELKVANRVLYLPPVTQSKIWQYVGAVDLEMILIQPIVKSYYFALPNKFFEAVQSMTPIIASDLPEMKALIDKYNIGLSCNINSGDNIMKCVDKMYCDKQFYAFCKENMIKAKQELCWNKEKEKLVTKFLSVMNKQQA